MDSKQPVLSLQAFPGEARLSSSDNINYKDCPICGNTNWKVYVNPSRGVWMCFAGEHSAGGKLVGGDESLGPDLSGMLEALHDADRDEPGPFRTVDPPLTRELTDFNRVTIADKWQVQSPDEFGIRFWLSTESGGAVGRLFIPYYDEHCQLIGFSGRRYYDTLDKDAPKYYNAGQPRALYEPLNSPHAATLAMAERAYDDTLFLVEGPFDAMRMAEAGYNVVALGGKTVPRSLEERLLTICRKYDIITVLLDLDACNDAFDLYLMLSDRLPPSRVVILGELPGKDPCELSLDRLTDAIDHILKEGLNA